jgi:pimeloyl-ACP methyl ester carboxylesterase
MSSPATPPSVAEEFKSKIAGARLEYIADCGHAPCLEKPAEFTRLLRAFRPGCFPVESALMT